MFYHFELMMAGIILLTAMTAGGFSLWWKRKQAERELYKLSRDEEQNI